MIPEKLKQAIEAEEWIEDITGGKENWISENGVREKVVKEINRRVTQYVADDNDLLDQLINFKRSKQERERVAKDVENKIQKKQPYTWITETTLKRWWEGTNRPTQRKLNVLLCYLNPHRRTWNADDPLEGQGPAVGPARKKRSLANGVELDLGRVEGQYNLFNRDIGQKDLFQVSNLVIGKDPGTHLIRFKITYGGGTLEISPEVHIVNQTQLQITYEGDPRFYILCFIGSTDRLNLIKGILVTHDTNYVPFSTFIILERVPPEGLYPPTRETSEVNANISQYLIQEGQILYPARFKYFNEGDLVLSQDEKEVRTFMGDWELFCNVGNRWYDKDESPNPYITKVVKGSIHIAQDPLSGYYMCKLSAEHLSFPYAGRLRLLENENRNFLMAALNPEQGKGTILLYLFLGSGDHDFATGIFNSLLSTNPMVSTGALVLRRSTRTGDNHEERIRNYLANIQRARLEPALNYQENIWKDNNYRNCPYAGLYKVYSYSSRMSSRRKCIAVGILEIHPNYAVNYKKEAGKEEARGRAEMNYTNLIIHLRDVSLNRYGAFFITTKDYLPRGQERYIFSGVFGGFARLKNNGVASRLVLEPVKGEGLSYESLEPERIDLYSSQYHQIDPVIRQVLSGRLKNLIGFMKEANTFAKNHLQKDIKEDIPLGEVFFQSALYEAQQKEVEKSLKMIRRAVRYSFEDLDRFERELNELTERNWVEAGIRDAILQDDQYQEIRQQLDDFHSA